jgi:hypothetical protein
MEPEKSAFNVTSDIPIGYVGVHHVLKYLSLEIFPALSMSLQITSNLFFSSHSSFSNTTISFKKFSFLLMPRAKLVSHKVPILYPYQILFYLPITISNICTLVYQNYHPRIRSHYCWPLGNPFRSVRKY